MLLTVYIVLYTVYIVLYCFILTVILFILNKLKATQNDKKLNLIDCCHVDPTFEYNQIIYHTPKTLEPIYKVPSREFTSGRKGYRKVILTFNKPFLGTHQGPGTVSDPEIPG